MKKTLRWYQEQAKGETWQYLHDNPEKRPLIVAPTGSGKSLLAAAMASETVKNAPGWRVLVLAHRQELIAQNLEECWSYDPTIRHTVYSASLKSKNPTGDVVHVQIQSARRVGEQFHNVLLAIIDECHLVNSRAGTQYAEFIEGLRRANPHVRVVGMSASPVRLDCGSLIGERGYFDAVSSMIEINQLISEGHLVGVRTPKGVPGLIDATGVRTKGPSGDYVLADLARISDTNKITAAAVANMIATMDHEGREKALVYCVNIEHVEHVRAALEAAGQQAVAYHSQTDADRNRTVRAFKADPQVRFLVNCDIFTTGFNFPALDTIVFLRATTSLALYIQVIGRVMRTAPGKADGLVLDYAGNIERHGPIDQIDRALKREIKKGELGNAPVKSCPKCMAIWPTATRVCEDCGHEFPKPAPKHGDRFAVGDLLSGNGTAEAWVPVESMHASVWSRPFDDRPPCAQVAYVARGETYKLWVAPDSGIAGRWFPAHGVEQCADVAKLVDDINDHGRCPEEIRIIRRKGDKYWRVVAWKHHTQEQETNQWNDFWRDTTTPSRQGASSGTRHGKPFLHYSRS